MRLYLGTPYSHPDLAVSQQRFEDVTKVSAKLVNEGHIVFSPITHTHPIIMTGLLPEEADGDREGNWDFWRQQDIAFLDWCQVLAVYKNDGWEESVGLQSEIDMIKAAEKAIWYLNKGYWK